MRGWYVVIALLLFLGCDKTPSQPQPQQVSGSIQTIQDAYIARERSLKNAREILALQDSLAHLQRDCRALQREVLELRADVRDCQALQQGLLELKIDVGVLKKLSSR